VDCPAGYYCPYEDLGSGFLQGTAEYSGSLTADDKFIECPAGYYCMVNTWDYTSYECPAGYYCPAGSNYPIPCKGGHYCTAGIDESGILPCAAGYLCDYRYETYEEDYCVWWNLN